MFEPPRCPYVACAQHAEPRGAFFVRRGSYRAKCRSGRVPRFQCKSCNRTFSTQTFREDYRDRKPELNQRVIEVLCSGVGYRQTARVVGMTRNNLEAKARKIARHVRWLDHNLKARAAACARSMVGSRELELHFDEFETFETRRNTRPLTVAVMIESRTRFVFAAVAAPIRPRGRMTAKRKRAIAAEEARNGPRVDRSRVACRRAFRKAAEFAPEGRAVVLHTDEKKTYPVHARECLRGSPVTHHRTSSTLARNTANPLHPINHTEGLFQDLVSRLRPRSWLVSKQRTFLNLHMALYCAWRNWVRPRFNFDSWCPGQLLGFAERRLLPEELVGWRQDWGSRSPCPYGDGSTGVAAQI